MDNNNFFEDKLIKTGTTTVGIVCKDGIVLAADRRATMGGRIVVDKKTEKVVKINEEIAVTIAGSVSDVQLLIKVLKAQLKLMEVRRIRKATVKETANLLGTMIYNNIRKFSMIPAITGFLLGGKDDNGLYLYSLNVDGSVTLNDDYSSDGSGFMFATGVLENSYKKGINVNEGVKLAIQAVNAAIQRDAATGNGIDVLTITKDGVKKVYEKEINTYVIP